jgi:pyridoxamine 5'-phosphate oxidase family protein
MMRFVALLVGVLAVILLVVLVAAAGGLAARRREGRVAAAARWRMRHYAQHGETVVSVALASADGHVIEEHVVDRFPDADADWERRFLAAREEAERRAFHLNADRPELTD